MPSLSEMPSEILHNIFRNLPPEDKDTLTLISCDIKNVAAPIIEEHKALKRQYGICHCASANEKFPTVTALLLEFIRKPHLTFYPKRLTIDALHSESDDDWDHPKNLSEREQIRHETSTSPLSQSLPGFEFVIINGDESWCLVSVLRVLKNLRLLDLTSDSLTHQFSFRELWDPLKCDDRSPILPHLTEVRLRRSHDAQKLGSLTNIEQFSKLPSVKTIQVNNFSEPDYIYFLNHKRSNRIATYLTELTILNSSFGTRALCDFLSSCQALQSFSYTAGWQPATGVEEDQYSLQDYYWICQALVNHASTTLQKLKVLPPTIQGDGDFVGHFDRFQTLKVLEINVKLVVRDSFSRGQRVLASLPSSLEMLILHAESQDSFDKMRHIIRDILIREREKLPHLKHALLMTPKGSTDLCSGEEGYQYQSLVEECEKMGLMITAEVDDEYTLSQLERG